jgi:hypothetical protein
LTRPDFERFYRPCRGESREGLLSTGSAISGVAAAGSLYPWLQAFAPAGASIRAMPICENVMHRGDIGNRAIGSMLQIRRGKISKLKKIPAIFFDGIIGPNSRSDR